MKNVFDTWFLNQKWSRRFLASHIFGWTVAWIQTIWLVWEIRKIIKIFKNNGANKNE